MAAGHKRWALYPPSRVPPGVEVSIDSDGSPGFEVKAGRGQVGEERVEAGHERAKGVAVRQLTAYRAQAMGGQSPVGHLTLLCSLLPAAPQTPTSLQWFLEIYPLLAPDQRPLELVQHTP